MKQPTIRRNALVREIFCHIANCYSIRGFLSMCSNNFSEAYEHFKMAVKLEPNNTAAVNNMAVCCLYLGKLKDALKALEALVHRDT